MKKKTSEIIRALSITYCNLAQDIQGCGGMLLEDRSRAMMLVLKKISELVEK